MAHRTCQDVGEVGEEEGNYLEGNEKLTDKIVYYGLWQNSHEVTSKVEELVGKEKFDALQAQPGPLHSEVMLITLCLPFLRKTTEGNTRNTLLKNSQKI